MNKILLDLGTHYGQGLREFIERFHVDESWRVYTFEANPVTYEKFLKEYAKLTPFVEANHAAVGDHFGTITFNLETPPNEDDTGMGSSVVPLDKWDPWGNNTTNNYFKVQSEVPCFDFSLFVKENFNKDDFIVIKMDIEGSEYDVLEKMIADKTIDYVNHISIEWHSRFFINKEEMEKRESIIIETLSKIDGLILESWR